MYKENAFVFSPRYRILRHIVFWLVHILVFSFLYKAPGLRYSQMHLISAIWVPAFIIYSYVIMYFLIPVLLLKGKYVEFVSILIIWAIAGYFLNYFWRSYVLFPVSDLIGYSANNRNPWSANSYMSMNVMAGFGSMIILFKYWIKKQKEYLTAEKEKINAELKFLKAQVHPHFLFNTLNNIYSFAIENSPKTPDLILKLSSLLRYILYEGRLDQVPLEKEISVMRDYIELEQERYGSGLEISLNFEGEIRDKFIAPLLLLPFLENAFKHGTSEQLGKAWLSMDLAVIHQTLRCKIVNSKNENGHIRQGGIGIENVRKRLMYLYPDKHELRLNDEQHFFVVSLKLELEDYARGRITSLEETPHPVLV